MTALLVVLAMAAVTYGCRVLFLVHPGRTPAGRLGLFLERFPLALFVALAAATLLLHEESVDPVPGYAALAGGVAGSLLTRRSLPGGLAFGMAAYWLARWLSG